MTRDVVVMKSEYHIILNHAWLISSERTRNKSHYKGGGTGKGRRGHHRNAIVCQSLKTNRHNWDRWKHIRYRLDNNCVYSLFAFSLHEKSLYIISPYDFIMRAILDFCGWMGVGVCVCACAWTRHMKYVRSISVLWMSVGEVKQITEHAQKECDISKSSWTPQLVSICRHKTCPTMSGPRSFLVWTVHEIDHALYVCCSELVYAWFKTDLVFILIIPSKQQSMYADYATKQFRW